MLLILQTQPPLRFDFFSHFLFPFSGACANYVCMYVRVLLFFHVWLYGKTHWEGPLLRVYGYAPSLSCVHAFLLEDISTEGKAPGVPASNSIIIPIAPLGSAIRPAARIGG